MSLEGGREGGGGEGGEGGILGSEGGEGGILGRERGREGEGEGGRDDCIHILIGMFNFFLYRNVLFMNSNMMHMLPTVHIIK